MKLSIIGSTGSIGASAVRISQRLGAEVVSLAAGRRIDAAEAQARLLRPRWVALADEAAAADLRIRLADTDVRVLAGEAGVLEAAAAPCDVCVDAVVGIAGLRPALAALEGTGRLALANKESLVCAGEIVLGRAKERGVEVIPVDSEHSAIFQCLQANAGGKDAVKRILLTASGGPFFGYTPEMLKNVTLHDALKHPNWSMGAKITVDSATLMNKGLEFIEAMQLFGVGPDQIEIVVQRESIIHSMVEFVDGAVIAQLGIPEMEIPIQYAITYPERMPAVPAPDFAALGSLSFSKPDIHTFQCLAIAMRCSTRTPAERTAMNGANEVAVAAFLAERLPFHAIPEVVEEAAAKAERGTTLEEVFASDRAARIAAEELIRAR